MTIFQSSVQITAQTSQLLQLCYLVDIYQQAARRQPISVLAKLKDTPFFCCSKGSSTLYEGCASKGIYGFKIVSSHSLLVSEVHIFFENSTTIEHHNYCEILNGFSVTTSPVWKSTHSNALYSMPTKWTTSKLVRTGEEASRKMTEFAWKFHIPCKTHTIWLLCKVCASFAETQQ